MIRKCRYCGRPYDSMKGSQVFCDSNPNRGRGYARWQKSLPDTSVTIGVIVAPRSSFWPQATDK